MIWSISTRPGSGSRSSARSRSPGSDPTLAVSPAPTRGGEGIENLKGKHSHD